MATCQTEQWVSTSPYVKLDVSIYTNTASQTTLKYVLYYIASSAANTSVAKSYSVSIAGDVVASGTYNIDGKKGTNTICYGTKVINETKATQTITCSCGFAFNLTWSGTYAGTKSASTTISVGAKSQYTISYNANGGSGAPSSQSKWHGESLTLSSTKPTRTGYSFLGWSTSSTATSATYASGATYTLNSAATLYAVWKAITYTITYNANGGSNAPAKQTKLHGTALTLTTAKPVRSGYTFLGWSTNAATNGNVMYESGESFTKNENTTLYAVWELSYVLPRIYNVAVYWNDAYEPEIDANGNVRMYASGSYDWETTYANPTGKIAFYKPDGTEVASSSISMSGGITSNDYGPETFPSEAFLLNPDVTYTVKITLTDSGGSTTVSTTLAGNSYPIDILAEGKGISFGGPASLANTAHFQWDAKFDKPVYGNVVGMNKLPEIPANDDFNNYMTTGVWAVYKNANAETIANMPVARAGRLEVWSSTGEGIRSEEWSYLRQRFIPYNESNATWERDIARGADNVWHFYDWWRSSLTPAASKKVYEEPVTLFSGNSAGTITLSDSVDNYEYLEIFFTDNNGEKSGYTKMHKPYSGVVNLFIVEAAGTNTYIRRTSYTFSGTTITPDVSNAGYLRVAQATASHTSGTNYIKITRVLGRNS